MGYEMLHPSIETASDNEITYLQEDLWEKQWKHVINSSCFYKEKLNNFRDKKITLSGLKDLPFTEKEELKTSQEKDYPFGDYIACDKNKIIRLHMTSGTTG